MKPAETAALLNAINKVHECQQTVRFLAHHDDREVDKCLDCRTRRHAAWLLFELERGLR